MKDKPTDDKPVEEEEEIIYDNFSSEQYYATLTYLTEKGRRG